MGKNKALKKGDRVEILSTTDTWTKLEKGDKGTVFKVEFEEDDEIIWEVEGNIREVMRVHRNLALFDKFVKGILDNKLMKKTMRSKLGEDDEKYLTDMLKNHTHIEVIKKASAEEIMEDGKSWWTKVKEKFKRVD